MEKKWLIKINDENELYYDSEKKAYRLRLFCPHCHKSSECQCYENFEDYEYDRSSEFPLRYCSYVCCILASPDTEIKKITKTALSLGIDVKPLEEYTEKEAEQIIDYIVEESICDVDEDSAGEQCAS